MRDREWRFLTGDEVARTGNQCTSMVESPEARRDCVYRPVCHERQLSTHSCPWRRAANGQKRSVTIFAKSTAQLPEDRSRLFVRYSTIAARAASLTAAPRSAAMGSRYPYRMLLHASESPNTPDAIPSASTKVIFAPLSARCYASEAPTMPALMTTTRLSRAFPISTFIL